METKKLTRRDFLGLAAGGAVGMALCGAAGPAIGAEKGLSGAGCPSITGVMPKRQFRAAWIATVVNIDWPSRPGLSVERQKQEFIRLVDEVVSMNLNAVVVQVRAAADAFYPSRYAPWSRYLTGVAGEDPGYDPLEFMLWEAHARNLEFHAWFNPYRVSLGSDPGELAPDSPAREHPEWVVEYGGQLYFDPGIPEARRLIEDSIIEAVENYDIDAVHFDDYFYPYPVEGQTYPDEETYQRYGAERFDSKADWRRDNVNRLIEELSDKIKQAKPWVKFGVSPFGVWRNEATDPTGSATTAGAQTYDDLYADTRTWIRNEWLDYVAPQVYWNIGFDPAAYDVLVPWWSGEVSGSSVALYVGQAAYKIGDNNEAWDDPDEMPSHLRFNQDYPEIEGDIYFSITQLLDNPLGFKDRLEEDLYRNPALVPIMPWLGGYAPRRVPLTGVRETQRGIELEWKSIPPGDNAAYYAVYRFDESGAPNRCVFNDPRRILATVRRAVDKKTRSYIDTTARPGRRYTYHVTAADRLHHESRTSNPRRTRRGRVGG